ncbi:MAG: hypothetical protein HY318_20200 [Armatimonadetes bacterium]|nr:hypothetical protein [Armatimonadota bacterium]
MATPPQRLAPQAKESQRPTTWMTRFEPALALVSQAGVILLVLAVGYILFGVFKGYLSNPTSQTISNMRLVGNLVVISSAAFVLSLLLLRMDEAETALFMGILGAVLYFGLPFGIGLILKQTNASPSQATEIINQKFVTAGQISLCIVILRFLYAFVRAIPEYRAREAKKANVGFAEKAKSPSQLKSGKPSVFSRCWQLPYCRESVRKACPAFVARKTCWKFKRGCYCDEEMIAMIVRGESSLGSGAAAKRAGSAYAKASTGAPKKRKPPCGKCFIYLEHQNLKHRAVGPFLLPAVLGIMYVLKDYLGVVYSTLAELLNSMVSKLSFNAADAASKGPDPLSKQSEYVIAFIIGVFMLIYLTKFVEYCIYKLKL